MAQKKSGGFILKALIIIFLFILILKILSLIQYQSLECPKLSIKNQSFLSYNNETKVIMYLPAVNSENNGVITQLTIEKTSGSGRTLTEIDNLLFWADTQHSIRIAKMVAGNITEKNLDNYDFIYTVKANASLIGGPSAGAALTLATISALLDKPLRKDVMITGTINSDGSIGLVSEILAKAKAARDAGANIFLVPVLQSRDVIYEEVKSCEEFGANEICTTETRPKKVNITQETGIQVYEVSTIKEAMNYFFS